ncbi:MAG: response regulator [Planctomyces sp.]|jgi:two-component system chemotaxis response regulator CheY|nr:response regulator [Planctomyces sp.]
MYALIIDDSRAMRRILRQIVEPLGFEIMEAGNGQEGLACLHQVDHVELTLVDWNMPVMNGLEFVKAVRADDGWREMKLVMVTTETEPAQMARALMAGVDEFVMKPFTADILLDKLRLIGVNMTQQAG